MSDLETWLLYHLPRTRVRISGTVTERFDLRTDRAVRKVQSQVALETGADPEAFYRIQFHKAKLSDEEFGLELTDDGRLVSTEAKSTGKLGKIVRNVFSFVTTVVGAVANLSLLTANVAPKFSLSAEDAQTADKGPVLAKYEEEHPKLAQLRRRLHEVLLKTREEIVELEEEGIDATPERRKEIKAQLDDLTASVQTLVDQGKELDVHFQAWKASKEQETSADLELTFELDELPTTSDVESWSGLPNDDQLGSFAPAYHGLDLVLARRDLKPLPSHSVPNGGAAGSEAKGVYYRQARPLELCLYVVRDGKLVCVKKTTELVMDEKCRRGFAEFGKTKWSKKSAKLEFSELGGLKTLKGSAASAAAAATDALKELPSDVKDALAKANEIIDEQQKLRLQGVEQRIAELEKRKELVQKEIALGEVLDTREAKEEIARLTAEVDLLKARKNLSVAERELSQEEAGSTLRLETDILTLRTALEQAQVERLKVEKELKKLQAPDESDENG